MTENLFEIYIDIYLNNLVVFFGENRKNLHKKMAERLTKDDLDYFKGLNFQRGKAVGFNDAGVTILWLNKVPDSVDCLAVLNHEIFHCVCMILERVGVKYSEDSDEAYAYLIGHLTRKIYEKLNLKF